MDFIQKVYQTINRHQLLHKGEKVAVGVSGGPDSIALLYTLHNLRHDLGINLHIVHLNHGLRKSADKDESFVKKIAQQLNIPISISKKNIKAKWQRGSLEDYAREIRQDLFIQIAKRYHCHKIATGHNQDDLIETILMRLIRGTGLLGMRGILPQKSIKGKYFIRPLIESSRKEIELFLKENKLPFRQDPTNKDLRIFRNKIRHQLLPLLEDEYNRNIRGVLANFAETVQWDYEYLLQTTQNSTKKIKHTSGKDHRCLPLRALQRLHPSLRRIFLRIQIEELQGSLKKITLSHLLEMEDLMFNRPDRAIVHLPNHIVVQKAKNHLILRKGPSFA